jgi:hypothetical protein
VSVVITEFVSYVVSFFHQITLDSGFIQRDNYDECNAIVIPSQKRRTKKRNATVAVSKILSKTQRKRLQKIVDKKKKKENVSVQSLRLKFVKVMVSLCHLSCTVSVWRH